MSHGWYVVFLNAGDVFPHPDVLSLVYKHLSNQPSYPDLLFAGATLSLPNGRKIYRAPKDIDKYIWHGLPANHQATYFRRDRLTDVQYDVTYTICGDYFLVATLFTLGATATYLTEPVVKFRVGDTSYRNPVRLIREPYVIQREILGLPMHMRFRSMLKRLLSTIGLMALSHQWLARRAFKS
jgi:putative colanic acid biosynthesis glycosyltransferase